MVKNKNLISTTGLVAAFVLFIAVNVLSNIIFRSARIDMTEQKLYTLSDGTRKIVSLMEEPLTLRYYFSDKLANKLPGIKSYGNRVKELLQEYEAISGGKLKLEIIDPLPFTEEEDRAVQYGLQGVPVNQMGELLYFGLAGINSTDDEEIIAFFQPDQQAFLEYEVTKLIHSLQNPDQPVVGVLSGLPQVFGNQVSILPNAQNRESWMIVEELRKLFEVRQLEAGLDFIPEDVDVLLVIHPKDFDDKTLYAIDQYVLGGGKTVAFVDPHAAAEEVVPTGQNQLEAYQKPRSSNLETLFAQWGIEVDTEKVAADIEIARQVNAGSQRNPQLMEFVPFLALNEEVIQEDDVVTADIQAINMSTPGFIKNTGEAKIEFTPLLQTTENAMSIPRERVAFFPRPDALLRDYKPGEEALTLAARISGIVQSAYPDGPPATQGDDGEETAAENENHLTESTEKINVIVVADVDMLTDQEWVRVMNFFGQRVASYTAHNALFLINAIENMSGSSDLISVRSRGRFTRPFTKLDEIQEEANALYREKTEDAKKRLQEAENKINELQQAKVESGIDTMILSPEQKAEIEKAREDQLKLRKELRDLQSNLRQDVEQLGKNLKLVNMALMPALVALFAVGLGVWRMSRRKGRR
jgi:ABC-type uncharacterized transport system involved in gliding motility auxiliary subunit